MRYKVHYQSKERTFKPACKTVAQSSWGEPATTAFKETVTCKKCIKLLKEKGATCTS